jgi:hypothetical protein
MFLRRTVLFPILIVAVLGAAYGGYWVYAADQLRSGVDNWIAAQRTVGVDIRYGTMAVGGFPYSLTITAGDVVAAGTAGYLAWEARTPELEVRATPWNYHRLTFRTESRPESRIANIATGERAQLTASVAEGIAVFDPRGRLESGRLGLQDVAADGSGPLMPVSVRALLTDFGRADAGAAEVAIRAIEIGLPPHPAARLGDVMQNLTATLVVHGAAPTAATAPALAAWRDNGGRVEVRFLEAVWGPVAVSASGEVGLDRDLQPTGKLATSTRGYREAISAVEEAGRLTAERAAQLRLLLGVMATRPADGGAARLDVDLRVANRQLFAGMIPLADLPHLRWRPE